MGAERKFWEPVRLVIRAKDEDEARKIKEELEKLRLPFVLWSE